MRSRKKNLSRMADNFRSLRPVTRCFRSHLIRKLPRLKLKFWFHLLLFDHKRETSWLNSSNVVLRNFSAKNLRMKWFEKRLKVLLSQQTCNQRRATRWLNMNLLPSSRRQYCNTLLQHSCNPYLLKLHLILDRKSQSMIVERLSM